ncbi:hypothetical protein [Legionella sp.]|uniref:hypothetical protein n=1 Tax=Legionella sp. TaxID=459 RepID=UPI000CB0505D|nr:hypothetical protein [Legionella sp.]PJE10910.1 MAG: hypothetical protein CK430_09635 [Legionella sp.]
MTITAGIAEINSLDDAKAAWELFLGRFFSPEIPNEVDVTFNPELRKFTPRQNHDAKNQDPSNADGRTDHSDDFDDFLNGNEVTIPVGMVLRQKCLDDLEQAIREGDYKHRRFSYTSLPFYALWLFKQNKITRQQLATILARVQVLQTMPIKETFRIVDDQGQFTQDAKERLLPILKKNAYSGGLTDWHVERFRLLMHAAPKSEQMFYTSTANPKIARNGGLGTQLGDALARNGAWFRKNSLFTEHNVDIHMSFGAIEGLQIAIKGISGAAAARAKLGKVSIDSVKEGVEYNYRQTAVSIPDSGVEAITKGIHNYSYSPMPAVTAHDVFHARLHNTIPSEFHMMLNHMDYIASKHTKIPKSKLLWQLVDREFHAFQFQSINLNSPQQGARLFVNLFATDLEEEHPLLKNDHLTDEGIAIVWDMVNQPELWQRIYKVDIDSLSQPYKKHILKMKDFAQSGSLKMDEHPKLINLKYRLFCTTSPADYKLLSQIIDTMKDDLLTNAKARLLFGKTKTNRVALKFGVPKHSFVITEENVKKFIPFLLNKYLFQGIDNQFIQQEARALSDKGVLGVTATALNEELQKFSSFEEKLAFLENCCIRIVKSEAYERKHPLVDSYFAFLKNPLTTSQRHHVRLLQEKMQELVTERLNELKEEPEKLEEFKWLMENRDSKLAHVNTKRFYLHFDVLFANNADSQKSVSLNP